MQVFLSHSTKDADFVKKLGDALVAEGFTPWLCEVDIEKAENFVARINEGLEQSDLALLVWSPDAALSAWTEQEWTSLLARQVEEHRTRLGIVLFRDHPLPPLLRTSNFIDARTDPQSGIREVLNWLKGRQSADRRSGLHAPIYLPDYRPQEFVGRGVYLAQLHEALALEPSAILLHGEPGTGKSTLALRFAWDAQKDFDAVIVQTCGHRPVDAIGSELADRLPIDSANLPPEKKLDAAKSWLRRRQSLLILDDVWSPEIRQLEPGPNCAVLYTSRRRTLPWVAARRCIELEKFSEAEAEELFHLTLDPAFTDEAVTRHMQALHAFARKVEYLPIAVAVGASLLREKTARALDRGVLGLRVEELTDGIQDIPQLFRKAIDAQPEREQKLLAACAICIQEGFWLPLAGRIAELSQEEWEDAADRLAHVSLLRVLDRDYSRFQLHALLREQARARLSEADLARSQQLHAATLEDLFQNWEKDWQRCGECLEEVIPAVRFLRESGELSRGDSLSDWGYALGSRIGKLAEAFRILKEDETSVAGRVLAQGKDSLGRSYGNQALILQAWGRLDEALALLRKQEIICLELGNKDGLQASYGNQAVILHISDRLDEALTLHKKEEALCLELGNEDGLGRSYGNQALILKAWGRLDEALALHKKEEALCRELGNKYGLQASYGNQALILQAWGQLDEALALLRKQEIICLELGIKDGLQASYGNQAVILHISDRLDEALAFYKKQEAFCLELGNKDGLQRSYGNQVLILQDWGRLDEALALHKKAEALCLELGNRDGLQRSYGNQASILQAWGRLDEALALLKKQESIGMSLSNKSGLAYCYWNWGLVAREQGDRKTEADKLNQALALFTELKMPRQRDAVQAELDEIGGIAG